MCPAGHYPPQHKQAGLQIQRNTNRNTASNSGEIRIQQIQSSMGSMNIPSHYVFPTSLWLRGYVVLWGFMGYTFYEREQEHTFADNASIKPNMLLNPEPAQKIPSFHHDHKPLFEGNVVWSPRKNRPVLPLIREPLFGCCQWWLVSHTLSCLQSLLAGQIRGQMSVCRAWNVEAIMEPRFDPRRGTEKVPW